jgi:NTE family protein
VELEAYGIFEGGGAKGLAHVGALSAAEQREIEFKGVAGASAGAIVASLIACGYRSSEMFDPNRPSNPESVYSIDLRRVLGPNADWEAFESAFRDARKLPTAKWLPWAWGWFRLRHGDVVKAISQEQGVFNTTSLERYLDEKLELKLLKQHPALRGTNKLGQERKDSDSEMRVLFKNVQMPLKIVAADIKHRRLIEFSQRKTPDHSVAKAVAASISLPFVFKPQKIAMPADNGASGVVEVQAVDGGLLSNFPAWLFDAERELDGPHIPTFGFRLVERPPEDVAASKQAKPWPPAAAYAVNLVKTVLSGDPLLETREIENLHEIPLTVSVGTLDFDLSDSAKCKLFQEGSDSANRHFGRPGFPRDPSIARDALAAVVDGFRRAMDVPSATLIRANIVCMTTRNTLRVTYSCHMDTAEDSDDRLEFPIDSGASGLCWTTRAPRVIDLTEARGELAKWKMDKYQLAQVRRDLASLLSYPIITTSGEMLGVLNLDSPDPGMLKVFDDPRVDAYMTPVALELAEILTGGR